MKLSDIFESPELRDEDKDQSKWVDYNSFGQPMTHISIETMHRRYNVLGDIVISDLPGEHFKVLLSKSKTMAGIFKMVKDPNTQELGLAVICLVYFKQPVVNTLPKDMSHNILQIDRVATVPAYEAFGIASTLYGWLIKTGYTIISDTIQYRGGMKLWKKNCKTYSSRELCSSYL